MRRLLIYLLIVPLLFLKAEHSSRAASPAQAAMGAYQLQNQQPERFVLAPERSGLPNPLFISDDEEDDEDPASSAKKAPFHKVTSFLPRSVTFQQVPLLSCSFIAARPVASSRQICILHRVWRI